MKGTNREGTWKMGSGMEGGREGEIEERYGIRGSETRTRRGIKEGKRGDMR